MAPEEGRGLRVGCRPELGLQGERCVRRGAVTRAAVSQLADARIVDAAATRPAALLVGAARRKSGAVGPAPPLLAHTVAANAQAVRTAVGTTGGGGAGCAGPAGPTRALAVAALAAARAAERARANVAVDRLPPLVALTHVVHARTTARAVVWALPLSTAFTGPQVIAVADALLAARAVATAVVRADAHVARWPAVMRVALALDPLCANLANAVAIDTQAAVWDLAVRPTPAREAEAGERAIACGADCTVSAADRVLGQGHRQQAERQDRNAHGGKRAWRNFWGGGEASECRLDQNYRSDQANTKSKSASSIAAPRSTYCIWRASMQCAF